MDDPAACQALMHRHPLATLLVPAASGGGAHLLPLVWVDEAGAAPGRLRGHVSRGDALVDEAQKGQAVLAVFERPSSLAAHLQAEDRGMARDVAALIVP